MYTYENSLVLGGNFLHTGDLPIQAKCDEVEGKRGGGGGGGG